MARLYFFLGIVLILVGIAFMFVMTTTSDNADGFAYNLFQSVLCENGERFEQVYGAPVRVTDVSPSSTFYCTNSEPSRREVTVTGSVTEIAEQLMTICTADETLDVVTNPTDPTDQTYYCESDGQRDVTINVVAIMIGIFGTMILLAVTFFIAGARRVTRNVTKNFMGQMQSFNVQPGTSTVIDMRDGSYKAENMEDVQAILQNVFGQMGTTKPVAQMTLAERLKQLEDAFNQGLITDMEYQRTRREILSNMDE